MLPSPRRAYFHLTAVAIATVGLTLCAPTNAQGGCGDYVVYTNPAHQKPSTDHGPAPVKCHGPNCSQAPPAAPMPEAPTTLRILTDPSLPISSGDSASPSEASALPFGPANGSPVRRPTDVFHPPR
jgi:hypothetical protein